MTPSGDTWAEREALARIGYTVALCVGTLLVLLLVAALGYVAWRIWRFWEKHRDHALLVARQVADLGGQLVAALGLVSDGLRAHVAQAEDARAARVAAEELLAEQRKIGRQVAEIHAVIVRGEKGMAP